MLQGEHGLDQAGDAGRRVQVADVGLDRAEGAEARARSGPRAEGPGQGRDLDGIAQRRAGAVGLDVADRLRRRRRRPPGPRRSPRAWPSTLGAVKPTLRAPSLLMAEPRITAWIGSPSAQGVRQALEHHDAGAAAADGAPGRGVEGPAVAVRREDAPRPGRGSRSLRQR